MYVASGSAITLRPVIFHPSFSQKHHAIMIFWVLSSQKWAFLMKAKPIALIILNLHVWH